MPLFCAHTYRITWQSCDHIKNTITNRDGLSRLYGYSIGEFECCHKSIIDRLLYVTTIQLLGLISSIDYLDKVTFGVYWAYLKTTTSTTVKNTKYLTIGKVLEQPQIYYSP